MGFRFQYKKRSRNQSDFVFWIKSILYDKKANVWFKILNQEGLKVYNLNDNWFYVNWTQNAQLIHHYQ